MTQSKNAIGNLINRYRAILKKCGLLNTFGSLAMAGMLVMGGASGAMGAETSTTESATVYTAPNSGQNLYSSKDWIDGSGTKVDDLITYLVTDNGKTTTITFTDNAIYDGQNIKRDTSGNFLEAKDGATYILKGKDNKAVHFKNWKSTQVGSIIYTNGSDVSIGDNFVFENNQKNEFVGTFGSIIRSDSGNINFGNNLVIKDNSATCPETSVFFGAIIGADSNDIAFGENAKITGNIVQKSNFMGSGIASNEGNILFANNAFIANNIAKEGHGSNYGGAIFAGINATFGNNTQVIGNGIQDSNTGSLGGAICANGLITFGDGSRIDGNFIQATDGTLVGFGGATLSSSLTATNTTFTNNKAKTGGAVYINGGTATFNVTDTAESPIQISGNTASDAGGFLYLAVNEENNHPAAIFNIADTKSMIIGANGLDYTAEGVNAHTDTIAGNGTLTKKGLGLLVVNSHLNDFAGAINVEAGTLNMATGFGENIIAIQDRANGSKETKDTGLDASVLTVKGNATANIGDLNINFAHKNTAEANSDAVGTKVAVESNGTFTAKDVVVSNKTYNKAGEDGVEYVTTTGWGEFNIADKAKAEIASLTVKDGGTFDKTGAGELKVKGDIEFVKAKGVANTLNFKDGGLAIGGNFDSTTGKFEIASDANSLSVGKTFTAASDAFLTKLETVTVGALSLNGKAEGGKTLAVKAAGDSFTFTGLSKQDSFFNGNKIEVSKGAVNLGTVEVGKGGTSTAAVAVTGGAFNVNSGEWTVGSVDTVAKGVTVTNGKLTVNGALNASAADGVTVGKLGVLDLQGDIGNTTGAVKVSSLGTVTAKIDNLVKLDGISTNDDDAVDTAKNKYVALTDDGKNTSDVFSIEKGGTVSVAGNLGSGQMTAKDLAQLAGLVKTDVGHIEFKNIKISGNLDDSTATSGLVAKDSTVTISDTNTQLNATVKEVEVKVASGTTSVDIKADDLRIVGSTDGGESLISTKGTTTPVETNIAVAEGGNVTFGDQAAEGTTTKGTLHGDIKLVGSSGTVNAVKGNFAVTGSITGNATVAAKSGSLKVDGNIGASGQAVAEVKAESGKISAQAIHTKKLEANAGAVTATDLTVGDSMKLTGGAVATVTNLTVDAGSTGKTITVGSTDGGAGKLLVGKATLNGASVFLDPAWKGNDTIGSASHAAIKAFGTDNKIDGLLTVGENSLLVLGDENTAWAEASFAKAGLTWGEENITAALAVREAMKLSNTAPAGGIMVDGSIDAKKFAGGTGTKASANNATFAANSLLIVDATKFNTTTDKAAITGDKSSTATINADAKLLIADAKVGDTVKVLDQFTTLSSSWGDTNILFSSTLQELDTTTATGTSTNVTVTVKGKDADTVYGDTAISSDSLAMLDEFNKNYADKTAGNAGLKFLAAAVSTTSGLTNDEVAVSLTSVNAVAAGAGAANVGTDAANLASNAATARVSMAAPIVATSGAVESADKLGMGVWFMPLYQSNNVDGMKAGNYKTGFESDVYGGAFGADYTFANGVRLGAALNMGTGESDSKGDLNATKSDSEFFGASLYAGYRIGNLGLMADFGYTRTNSEVDMTMPVALGGDLEADVDADIYSVGARAEYKIGTGIVDLVPHAGVRYTAYRQDSYNVDYKAGGTVRSMEDADMDTWQLPIGVSASKAFAVGAWTLQPRVDLSYIYAFGDTDMDSKGRVAGTTLTDSMNSEVFDEHTFEIGLGLDSKYGDAWTLGLDYTYQGSENRDAHGVYGTVRFEF